MAIIGIDVGTSGCKACAYSLDGRLLSQAKGSYTEYRGDGIREIDPDEVRGQVLNALRTAAGACPQPIEAISVTCLGESFVCLDEAGHVLCRSMVTGDRRGEEEAEELAASFGEEEIFRVTGLTPGPLYSLPKLMWLRRHTGVLEKTAGIFFYEDYVGYLLTGERRVSTSTAARSMALNIHKAAWDERLLGMAGLHGGFFSRPVASGQVIGEVRKEILAACGMSGRIPVVSGAHDQACAALGSGLAGPSLAADGIGTCECLSVLMPEGRDQLLRQLDMPRMIFPAGGSYFSILEVTTCGALMNWGRDVLLAGEARTCAERGEDFFYVMDKRVEGRQTDVLILPQFGSSGNPDMDFRATGSVCGLTLETTQEDLYLALRESMIYQLRLALEAAQKAGLALHPGKIVISGGAAASGLTAQLRADILRCPVLIPKEKEAGTLGCMILAAVAIGAFPDPASCMRQAVRYGKEILPSRTESGRREENYLRFKEYYNRMHNFGL